MNINKESNGEGIWVRSGVQDLLMSLVGKVARRKLVI